MHTIRPVGPSDHEAILTIYNHYVTDTVISFETSPLTLEEMSRRIDTISSSYPYFVCENQDDGSIAGYCYAHQWKERAAYSKTLETTIYLSPDYTGSGIGKELMEALIKACRAAGFETLIACITYGNHASCRLHEKLGFSKVSHFHRVGKKFGFTLDVIDYQLIL